MSYHSLEDRLAKQALQPARQVHRAAGPARRAQRAPTRAPPADPRGRTGLRRRDHRQPTRRLRAAACRRTHPGGRVSTSTNQDRARATLSSLPLPRPRLTVVPKVARPMRRMPFAALVIAVLATGLVGLLLLNTSMERGAYQVTALRSEAAALGAAAADPAAAGRGPAGPAGGGAEGAPLGHGAEHQSRPSSRSRPARSSAGRFPGLRGNQFDIGGKIGPRVDRLGKIAPIVGGEANGAGTHLVRRPAATTATKGGDTKTGSRRSQH